ncbi:MAG TPA: hypothetical protein VL475_13465 [Planctomycetaceae bacterium]|jgi:hypothetical protein|nr:hypothetical protein [Planctomycetaceae bacterium]
MASKNCQSAQDCPSENSGAPRATFERDIRHKTEERLEAARIRAAILDGYWDLIEGRAVPYEGDLPRLLEKHVD